jgi:hypothetical protein
MRTRPYRNPRIIAVLRDLYFTGDTVSFAQRHDNLFPTYHHSDGVIRREIPVPMVALVATAVSNFYWRLKSGTNLICKLYASLHEWRTGEFKGAEFSTTTFLDVYDGHVNTFEYIRGRRATAFNIMMGEIYSQARYYSPLFCYSIY